MTDKYAQMSVAPQTVILTWDPENPDKISYIPIDPQDFSSPPVIQYEESATIPREIDPEAIEQGIKWMREKMRERTGSKEPPSPQGETPDLGAKKKEQ